MRLDSKSRRSSKRCIGCRDAARDRVSEVGPRWTDAAVNHDDDMFLGSDPMPHPTVPMSVDFCPRMRGQRAVAIRGWMRSAACGKAYLRRIGTASLCVTRWSRCKISFYLFIWRDKVLSYTVEYKTK
jgi:hypothetical protein